MSTAAIHMQTEGVKLLPALPEPNEKCDRCGSALATIAVLFQNRSKLVFCYHDFKIVRELESFQRTFYSMNGNIPL